MRKEAQTHTSRIPGRLKHGSCRVRGVRRGRLLSFTVDGEPLEAYEGESIAAALFASGHRLLRRTSRCNEPRSLFCGMGVCLECAMQINGHRNVLACQTPVADGMRVESQRGEGTLESKP